MGMVVLGRARSSLGWSLGWGWQQGWAGGTGHAVPWPCCSPCVPRTPQSLGSGVCHGFCVGQPWVWGLPSGCPKDGPRSQGEFLPTKGNPNHGKIQCCCWQHQSPHSVSAQPPEFNGIRCLHTKLSRCGCVGWAETFLCRSNMQLMPMIEELT